MARYRRRSASSRRNHTTMRRRQGVLGLKRKPAKKRKLKKIHKAMIRSMRLFGKSSYDSMYRR